MSKNDILKGGDKMYYESSNLITLSLETKTIEMKFRNENTDGKFVTSKEYDKLIRIKKLNNINKESYG